MVQDFLHVTKNLYVIVKKGIVQLALRREPFDFLIVVLVAFVMFSAWLVGYLLVYFVCGFLSTVG